MKFLKVLIIKKTTHQKLKVSLMNKKLSSVPKKEEVLIENFPYNNGQYLCFFTFMGKQTNQTLCEILVKFLEDNCKISTSDYTINEYSLALFINKNANFRLNFKKFIYKKNKNRFSKNLNS